jgi:membrane protease YdiL (CAAX protease family)
MKSLIEPLILYWVLFFRISAGGAPEEVPGFSWTAETWQILMYTLPSLTLVWYLLLRAKSLKEMGITLPRKKDFIVAVGAFTALTLIGVTISLVSAQFGESAVAPRQSLSPKTAAGWAVLVVSCVSSAYLEESFFRFYLLSKREEMGLGPLSAALGSAMLFSICHIYEGPWGFLNSALSGVVLAFAFLRFRSLHGLAVAHALYNILAFILG